MITKEKTRISKWRKYREEIDSNENIHFSIVNTDKELKSLLKSIDFNIQNEYQKAGYISNTSILGDKLSKNNEKKKVQTIIEIIEKSENNNQDNNFLNTDFSSHKYDSIIEEDFKEFMDKQNLENNNQETTNLKINKINIVDNKEK